MAEYKSSLRLRVVFRNGVEQKVLMRCDDPDKVWDQLRNNFHKMEYLSGPCSPLTQGFWIRMTDVQYIEPIWS